MSEQTPKPIELNLTASDGESDGNSQGQQSPGQQGSHHPHQAQSDDRPVMGYIATTFGVLSIFMWAIVFAPLGIVGSIIALFMGQGMWAFIGLATSMIGIITSPFWWGILGLAALANWLGFGF